MERKTASEGPDTWSISAYSPARAVKLLNCLTAGLTQCHGRKLTIGEMAAYAGLSTSTMFDWLTWSRLRQIECLIRLLEALPKAERKRILNTVCRVLPTITSRRISWSEAQVSGLEEILQKQTGVTVVQGEENARGFVVTALGHSAWRQVSATQGIFGIDVRFPGEFVPVPGIVYLNEPSSPNLLHERIEAAWSLIERRGKRIIVLNGIWRAVPALQAEIKSLSGTNHVVIGDALQSTPPHAIKGSLGIAHTVTASEISKRRIKVTILSM